MANWLSNLTFGLVSKPTPNRPLLRHVERASVTRIVEIGLGDGSRAKAVIAQAQRRCKDDQVSYTGIDLFEACEGSLSLKTAHQSLHPLGAKVRLIPGNAKMALTRSANELRGTDLTIVAATESAEGLNNVWHLVHRMLHKESQVWIEGDDGNYEVLTVQDVTAKMLDAQQKKRKAA